MTLDQILIRRGLLADIPVLAEGELGFATDTNQVFVGTSTSTNELVGGGSGNPGNFSVLVQTMIAGATAATGLVCRVANPGFISVNAYAQLSDATGTEAFYQVTAAQYTVAPSPSTPPTLAASGTGSSLSAGVYKVAYTYTNAYGETQASPLQSVTVAAGQNVGISSLSMPSGVTGINYYASVAAGSSTLEYFASGTGGTQTLSTNASGAAVPAANTTNGLLLTRIDNTSIGATTASATYAFTVANGACLAISGSPGLSSVNLASNETPSGTINGTNTTFTLAHTPSAGSLSLYQNSLRNATSDYSVSGSTLTMTTAPATGDTLICDYRY